jgi:cytochrome P450
MMQFHPEIQRKAQEELDRVVGRDRLPAFSDKENLPYLNAMYKEIMRWFPNGPLGIPHAVFEEDEYRGMRIPKGSVILPNVWQVF